MSYDVQIMYYLAGHHCARAAQLFSSFMNPISFIASIVCCVSVDFVNVLLLQAFKLGVCYCIIAVV